MKAGSWTKVALTSIFFATALFSLPLSADEEGDRERLNLYDRNKRQLQWERSQRNYFHGNNNYQYRRDYYHNRSHDYYDAYERRRGGHRTISEPPTLPPE